MTSEFLTKLLTEKHISEKEIDKLLIEMLKLK